ncbi:MAG: prepilin-type N-terminal cleavage/methylation domain-containing protein [Planctomycetes bacterium]|nr:prepilin-type N-terminal cleavage/methylation domain-containing protein [Planctomycetota bacterium]
MVKTYRGFTVVELLVVVLIVGILVTAAIPMMKGRTDATKWSEAKMAMGTIARALRTYGTEKGSFADAPSLAELGIMDSDLDGTYFSHEAYTITSASASNGQTSFVITCTVVDSLRADVPTSPAVMALTCNAGNGYQPTFAALGE